MFMTSFIMIIYIFYEYVRYTPLRRINMTHRNLLVSIIATLGIAWEQPHRRVDITYYVVPRSLEIYWNMLKNRKLVWDFPGQNALLIAVAMGMVAYKF